MVLDAEDQYALAKREFEEKNWNRAVVELQKLIFNYPGAAFVDSAQYLLGMAYFNQKEYPLAIGEFSKLLSSYPTSQLADDAAFMIAQSRRRRNRCFVKAKRNTTTNWEINEFSRLDLTFVVF